MVVWCWVRVLGFRFLRFRYMSRVRCMWLFRVGWWGLRHCWRVIDVLLMCAVIGCAVIGCWIDLCSRLVWVWLPWLWVEG